MIKNVKKKTRVLRLPDPCLERREHSEKIKYRALSQHWLSSAVDVGLWTSLEQEQCLQT